MLLTSVDPSAPEHDLDLSGLWYEPALFVLFLLAIAGAVTVLIAVCASRIRDRRRRGQRLGSFDAGDGRGFHSVTPGSSGGPGCAPSGPFEYEDDRPTGLDRPIT